MVRLGEAAGESREPGGLVREGGPVVESSGEFLGSERNWYGKNLSVIVLAVCVKNGYVCLIEIYIYISRNVIQICFM